MERDRAEQMAMGILQTVVDAVAERRYRDVPGLVEMGTWTWELLEEHAEEHLRLCGLSGMDRWRETRATIPSNPSYEQLNIYSYKDGSGFAVDYDLTSDGELNDLTLQMEFLYDGEGGLRPVLLDLHVM